MTVVEIKDLATLKDFIYEHSITVVTFGGESWCIPCQRLAPHLLAASEKLIGVDFAHVDVNEADPELILYYGIQGVPTVVLFAGYVNTGTLLESRTAPALIREINLLTDHSI